MIEYVTARFPENRKERVTKRRAMVDRLHTFIPPDSRMRLRLVGESFGHWRRERDGVARVLEIVDRSEVGQKLVVQRESDREQLSVRQVETLFVRDLGAHPMIELLSAELVEEFSMEVLRDGGLYVCRYVDGTTTVSKHGYVKKTKPRWKGAARDWFVRTGGMDMLWKVARFQVQRIKARDIENAHVICENSIYTHPYGWTGYRGVTHYHTHLDVPGGVGCL